MTTRNERRAFSAKIDKNQIHVGEKKMDRSFLVKYSLRLVFFTRLSLLIFVQIIL